MERIDLRSDTVTRPTPEMLTAMNRAAVGDDVYGEDPTVNRLEAETAALLGKDAALFVPTGTMANLVALLTHCPRGTQVILGMESHIFCYEQGGMSGLGSLFARPVHHEPDGGLAAVDVERIAKTRDLHTPRTSLIAIESTQNRCGGKIPGQETISLLAALGESLGIPLHLDGARLWNTAVASNRSMADLAAPFASVSVCFSKGLGAPAGSVVAGTADWVAEARRNRKMLGGGMRQAGVLAAACLHAVETQFAKLAVDHGHAKDFAHQLTSLQAVKCETPQTNIVNVELLGEKASTTDIMGRCASEGVLFNPIGHRRVRFVFHRDVSKEQMLTAARVFRQAVEGAY